MARSICNAGKNSVLVINGRRILGFNDADDAITIEYSEDAADVIEGMNGAAQINLSGSNMVEIGIKLLVSHPDHAWLNKIDSNLRDAICVPLDISFTDVATGEGGTSDAGTIITSATISTGKSADGEREWTLKAANWIKNDIQYENQNGF